MRGGILRGLAALTTLVTVMVIALMVTGVSADMRRIRIMGTQRGSEAQQGTAPCPMMQGKGMGIKGMVGMGCP